ncbi:MAG: hypothetical protein KF833_21635 [Verrucomicrobiae bacterium]|nr:hypothetical protein [Verrucomicrobiae bacterium]
MTAGSFRSRDTDPHLQRMVGALVISLLAHLAFFGVFQLGNQLQWWQSSPFATARQARLAEQQQEAAEQRRARQQPLIFVQVALPTEETPDETPFYSSASSRAANPEPGEADQPRLDGSQDRIPRTESAPHAFTGPASPPPQPEGTPAADFDPIPEPAVPEIAIPNPAPPPEIPHPPDTAIDTERHPPAGDLALVRPDVRPAREPDPPSPEPTTPASDPTPTQPAPSLAPAPVDPVPTPRPRPRTVVEAKVRQQVLAGERMRQEGGVRRTGPMSLEVRGTGFGAYDEALVAAVQNRWFALLHERRFAGGATGHVVVRFRLYDDGSVRIVEATEATVDAILQTLCVRAIRDPAPYAEWPSDMRRMIGSNSREIRFTFYYH